MKEISRDIYPMPLFVRLEVRDVKASLAWYQQKLGALDLFTLDGPHGPVMSHLRFAKYADLMLVPETKPNSSKGQGLSIYITVMKGELDALATQARDEVIEGPIIRPWNVRELVVQDPDGFTLIFAEGPVDEKRTFEEVMSNTRKTV
jgi:catechol 2,3-dioxygenase-like lactoylglutathione lyase family enzyme